MNALVIIRENEYRVVNSKVNFAVKEIHEDTAYKLIEKGADIAIEMDNGYKTIGYDILHEIAANNRQMYVYMDKYAAITVKYDSKHVIIHINNDTIGTYNREKSGYKQVNDIIRQIELGIGKSTSESYRAKALGDKKMYHRL